MFAWRARISFISPTHRGKVFAFWYDRAPVGVEIIPTFTKLAPIAPAGPPAPGPERSEINIKGASSST